VSAPNFAGRPHSELPTNNLSSLFRLAYAAPDGDILELGVYKGGSAWFLSQALKPQRILHLYDTFTGIPHKDQIDSISVGAFHDTDLSVLREKLPNAVFHVGIFPGTLTDDIKDLAFVHIDCDQYATCKAAIELLWPRLLTGGRIAFDDYPFEGIKKAIHEYFDPIEVPLLFSEANIPYVVKS
jgi:O-methyltransferase